MSPLSCIRQRLANAGTDRRQLDVLRRALAETEDAQMLRALAVATSELSEIVADDFLNETGDLKDHIAEKAERLGCDLVPARRSVSAPERDNVQSNGSGGCLPAVEMTIGPWVADERGILTRFVYNAADAPPP
jgi:hypothetical protein